MLFYLVYLSIFSGLAALMTADIARNLWSLVCSCVNSYWTFHLFPLLIFFFFKLVAFSTEFNLFTPICFVLFMIMDLPYILYEILLDHTNRSNFFKFDPFLYEILLDLENRSIPFNFVPFWMVFVWNPTRPHKWKQPFQFWLVFDWFLHKILDDANRSNLFNFDRFYVVFERNHTRPRKSKQPFHFWLDFEWFWKKSYQTMEIEASFSILTRFWIVFVWNRTRPCKSKQPFEFWPIFEWFL